MSTFRCPVCDAECPTLRALLACHPRELRRLTDRLGQEPVAGMSLTDLLCWPLSEGRFHAVHRFLHRQEVEAS